MKNNKEKVTIREVYHLIQEFRDEVRECYVTKPEFLPVKTIAFGMVGIIIVAVLTAILAGVISAVL